MDELTKKPTIKGIFIKSHIQAVREKKGDEGIQTLQQLLGKPLEYKNSDDVPVSEEVKLLEYAVEILSDSTIDPSQKHIEAGKLHFRNFTTTPLGKIIFSMFRTNFKLMMLQAQNIAGHVFNGVQFRSVDVGEKEVKIIMNNNDYPIEHFQGLFMEWLSFAGLQGTVEAKETSVNQYEYTMKWQ
jgi:uncharacterized protein (TIGR02265 family)